MKCTICGSSAFSIAYEGYVRVGKFGNLSNTPVQAKKCLSCSSISLPRLIENQAEFYESKTYRQEVDGVSDIQDYFRMHDSEQLKHLSVSGTSIYRNRVVADIGCGAGSFLDYIHRVCKTAIAIEPASLFRKSLAGRGYVTYPYAADALADYESKVDVAVSFSVVEHIENPLVFMEEIYRLLSDDGKLIISTPNTADVLLEAIPDVYAPFFYRKAHLWYFDAESLRNLLKAAGFMDIDIVPFQRFGLGNFLSWVRDRVPKGNSQFAYISETVDAVWRQELERTGLSDYLYAVVSKCKMEGK